MPRLRVYDQASSVVSLRAVMPWQAKAKARCTDAVTVGAFSSSSSSPEAKRLWSSTTA